MHEDDKENLEVFAGLSETDREFVKSILCNFEKLLQDLIDQVEHRFGLKTSDYLASIEKYQFKNKSVISAVQTHKPPSADLKNWDKTNPDFSWLALTKAELIQAATDFLISIAPETSNHKTIKNYVQKIASRYRMNFYHNLSHACSVMHVNDLISFFLHRQIFYVMWHRSEKIQQFFDRDELFINCAAALAHDMGHSKRYRIWLIFIGGKNNMFQVYSKNELSCMSHERAVLEHYHSAQLIDVLNDASCNILQFFAEDKAKNFKDMMINAIMCTDMSRHFSIIEEFKSKKLSLDPSNRDHKFVKFRLLFSLDSSFLVYFCTRVI